MQVLIWLAHIKNKSVDRNVWEHLLLKIIALLSEKSRRLYLEDQLLNLAEKLNVYVVVQPLSFHSTEGMRELFDQILLFDVVLLDINLSRPYTFQLLGASQALKKPTIVLADINQQLPHPLLYEYTNIILFDTSQPGFFLTNSIQGVLRKIEKNYPPEDLQINESDVDWRYLNGKRFNALVNDTIEKDFNLVSKMSMPTTELGRFKGLYKNYDGDYYIIYYTFKDINITDEGMTDFIIQIRKLLKTYSRFKISKVIFFNRSDDEKYIEHRVNLSLKEFSLDSIIMGIKNLENHIRSSSLLSSRYLSKLPDHLIRSINILKADNYNLKRNVYRVVESNTKNTEIATEDNSEENWRQIATYAAHKLGNPIFTIDNDIGNLPLAIKSGRNEMVSGMLSRIKNQLDKAKYILKQFKSIEAATEISQEFVSSQILDSKLKESAGSMGIVITTNIPENIYLYIDKNKFIDCFDELMRNSLENIDGENKECSVVMEIERDNDSRSNIVIRYCDNGLGIEDSIKPIIFNALKTTRKDGTGLGLYIVKTTIQQHGGSIIENGVYESGAQFVVKIPNISSGDLDEET